jgi:hypothetical protein
MLKVIDRHTTNPDFGIPEGDCADCGSLVLFAKDVWGKSNWTHKFELTNAGVSTQVVWFEPRCPNA